MIYATIIIVVTLICVTKLTPAFLRHRLKYERAYKLEINQLKHEITDLQQTSAYIYEQWFKDLTEREEKYNKLLDKLYQLEHPEEYENS